MFIAGLRLRFVRNTASAVAHVFYRPVIKNSLHGVSAMSTPAAESLTFAITEEVKKKVYEASLAIREGEYAYILWSAETTDTVYEVGRDTFVVRDGKIVAQSIHWQDYAQGLETSFVLGGVA